MMFRSLFADSTKASRCCPKVEANQRYDYTESSHEALAGFILETATMKHLSPSCAAMKHFMNEYIDDPLNLLIAAVAVAFFDSLDGRHVVSERSRLMRAAK